MNSQPPPPTRDFCSRSVVLNLSLLLAAALVGGAQIADAATPLPNGGSVSGVIVTTGQDSYEFTATVGDLVELRIGDTADTGFSPQIELRSPSDAPLDSDWDCCAAWIQYQINETGTFTVLVDDRFSNGGAYTLHLARMPGANEHGSLINDGVHSDTIDLGDLDTYALMASAGDHIELRIADVNATTLVPQLTLYPPSGYPLPEPAPHDHGSLVAEISEAASESGAFTVLVDDGADNHRGAGDYNLYFARIPGANEHGALAEGIARAETIDVGDLDTFTLTAVMGEAISLELEKTSGTMSSRMELYDPSGTFKGSASSNETPGSLLLAEPGESGTYTVLVMDGSQYPTESGDYTLTCLSGCSDVPAVPALPLGGLLLAIAIASTGLGRIAPVDR